jgi:hypothetical protein
MHAVSTARRRAIRYKTQAELPIGTGQKHSVAIFDDLAPEQRGPEPREARRVLRIVRHRHQLRLHDRTVHNVAPDAEANFARSLTGPKSEALELGHSRPVRMRRHSEPIITGGMRLQPVRCQITD